MIKIHYIHKNFVRLCHSESRESLKLTIGKKIFHQMDSNNKVRAIKFSVPKNIIVKTTVFYITIFISAFEFFP